MPKNDWPEMREGTLVEGSISASNIESVDHQDDVQLGGLFWYELEGREGRFSDHVYQIPVEILARHLDIIKSDKLKNRVLAWINESRTERQARVADNDAQSELERLEQDKQRKAAIERLEALTTSLSELSMGIETSARTIADSLATAQPQSEQSEQEQPKPTLLIQQDKNGYYIVQFGSEFSNIPTVAIGPHRDNPNYWQIFAWDNNVFDLTPVSQRRIRDLKLAIRIALGGIN